MSANPFVGKVTSGGNFSTEIPDADSHHGILIALIDLGTHEFTFKGKTSKKRDCVLVWDLTETEKADGTSHVVCKRYTLSKNLDSALVAAYAKWERKKYNADHDFNPLIALGKPWDIPIEHQTKTKDNKERTYASVGDPGPVRKGVEVAPSKHCPKPFCFFIGGNVPLPLQEWLPRVYGDKIEDLIVTSPEWQELEDDHPQKVALRKARPAIDDEADNGQDDDAEPF